MSRLSDAWEAAEKALMEVTPYPHKVTVYLSVPFLLPYRARVVIEWRPKGGKRNRHDAVQGEGLVLAEALEDLVAKLRDYATSGRYDHAAEMAEWRERAAAEDSDDDASSHPDPEP